jgi:hypothetical protein
VRDLDQADAEDVPAHREREQLAAARPRRRRRQVRRDNAELAAAWRGT